MHDAAREAELRREPQVDDAGLRDDAGHRDARRLARGEPRREMPAGGVPDRDDAVAVERDVPCAMCRQVREVVDRGGDVVERLRVAAAREPAEAAVLDVPRRPAARGEVGAQRAHQLAAVLRAPEAAVEHDGDGEAARRRPGRKSSPYCERARPYGWRSGGDTQRARRLGEPRDALVDLLGVTPE